MKVTQELIDDLYTIANGIINRKERKFYFEGFGEITIWGAEINKNNAEKVSNISRTTFNTEVRFFREEEPHKIDSRLDIVLVTEGGERAFAGMMVDDSNKNMNHAIDVTAKLGLIIFILQVENSELYSQEGAED